MAGDEHTKDEALKTPNKADQPTTPLGPPEPSEPTSQWSVADVSLRTIAERYDLLAEVGRGGMGIVYRARDRETREVVALKVLKPEIAARSDVIERFKTELRLARKITHKNVCRTHDLHRFGDTVVIAMEFVEGESLRSALSRPGGVSVRGGVDWANQICAALAEAHAQGIVHRDLKPENIVIDRQGQAKVMDFGIAHSFEAEATQTGTVMGTPAYMSPEQAQGNPADTRSDIYSLGLILYEMFIGRQAFKADTPVAYALKQIHDTPAPPREVEPDLPSRIDRAIQKCLEKNPNKRFQSVADLAAALTQKPEAKAAPAAGEEVELPLHLTRWQRSDWVLVAAAIVGLTLFFPFFNRTSPAPRTKITFDRGALRRIAEEYAQRLGAPRGGNPAMQLWWAGDRHDYVAEHAGAPVALELTNNPVPYWEWNMVSDNGTRVGVDHRGSLVSFSRDFPPGPAIPSPSLEEARLFAEKNLREFFGRDPSHLSLETASNSTWSGQPATAFDWLDPKDYHGLKHRYRVRLVGSQTAFLDDSYDFTKDYEPQGERTGWQILPVLAFDLLLLIVGISQRRLVDIGARWRIAFVGFTFYIGLYSGSLVTHPVGGVGMIFASIIFGVAFAFLAFFLSVAFERAIRRVWPGKLTSLAWLFDRRAASETCGLAILRGTLVGLGLLGVDAFMVWAATTHLGMRLDPVMLRVEPARTAMIATGWSVAFVTSKELFQGLAVAVIVTFLASFLARLARRRWLALAGAAVLAAVTIPGPVFNMAAVQPYPGKLVILALECLLLVWVLSRFDVLTVIWVVFTFGFWWANYYLLLMFEPTGAAEQWMAFAVFGLFVAAAGVIAFQSPLRVAYRQAATAVE